MILTYPLKHWLCTLALGPLILWMYDRLFTHNNPMLSGIEFYFMFFLFGFVFSIPALVVYYFSFRIILGKVSSKIAAKLILLAIAVPATLFTFYLIGGTLMHPLMISYSAALIVASMFFKLNGRTEKVGS
jgi:hypothetical protein